MVEGNVEQAVEAVSEVPQVFSDGSDSSLAVDLLRRFAESFKTIRGLIEEMDDTELFEFYEQLKAISNVSWVMRCCVLGIARDKARRGDKMIASLAKSFGIGVRAAQMDIQLYDAFIKDNPDFEPELPADFYHKALKVANPLEAIAYALSRRAETPSYPAQIFAKELRGEIIKEKIQSGYYKLVRVDFEGDLEDERMELYGRTELFTINGEEYARIR